MRKKYICLECGANWRETGLGFAEEGITAFYKVFFENGEVQFELDEVEDTSYGANHKWYFCPECKKELDLGHSDVEKILRS
jgi:DNA-directed RNA polymerase subunit RPC12/RpoP